MGNSQGVWEVLIVYPAIYPEEETTAQLTVVAEGQAEAREKAWDLLAYRGDPDAVDYLIRRIGEAPLRNIS